MGQGRDGRADVARSPREVAEDVRRMVAGEDVVFADLFAEDAVFTYPFAGPGMPDELVGREAIREFFGTHGQARSRFRMDGVAAVIRETDDPEVVVAEIRHHGWSHVTNAPYRHTALGVIRVRDGLIVHYDDYMNPIATARLLGRTKDLADALASELPRAERPGHGQDPLPGGVGSRIHCIRCPVVDLMAGGGAEAGGTVPGPGALGFGGPVWPAGPVLGRFGRAG